MAFVPGDQHDLFISSASAREPSSRSYAHEDDREWVNRPIAHRMSMNIRSAAVTSMCLALVVLGARTVVAQNPGRAVDKNLRVPVGFHEFEMFGDSSVYLSHYPMFGSIHAYQVLLEVTLTGEGNDPRQLYLSHKQKNPLTRYSLSPETPDGQMHYWVMPDVIKPGQKFRANIHWQKSAGHPQYISRNVTVEIVKVIYFRLFQPDDKKPDVLSYLLFGNGPEAFLAHYIANYPDFDHIVAVTGDTGKLLQGGTGAATLVTVPGRKNSKEVRLLKKDEKIVARVNGNGDELKLGVRTEIHYEAGLEIQR
jgi:hypothetical protein